MGCLPFTHCQALHILPRNPCLWHNGYAFVCGKGSVVVVIVLLSEALSTFLCIVTSSLGMQIDLHPMYLITVRLRLSLLVPLRCRRHSVCSPPALLASPSADARHPPALSPTRAALLPVRLGCRFVAAKPGFVLVGCVQYRFAGPAHPTPPPPQRMPRHPPALSSTRAALLPVRLGCRFVAAKPGFVMVGCVR